MPPQTSQRAPVEQAREMRFLRECKRIPSSSRNTGEDQDLRKERGFLTLQTRQVAQTPEAPATFYAADTQSALQTPNLCKPFPTPSFKPRSEGNPVFFGRRAGRQGSGN